MQVIPYKWMKKKFCEWCSFLGIYNNKKGNCILCESKSLSEDEICEKKFLWEEFKYKKYIWYYVETIDAISQNYQKKSSSGGLTTSLLADLLERKEIDYAIVVWWSQKHMDFRYTKVDHCKDLYHTQRSAYYPISLIQAINILEKNKGVCAITCIPSAAKAFELLKETQPELKNKIKYLIGLTYHSTKTKQYTQYLCKKSGKNNGLKDVIYCSYRNKDTIANSLHDFVIRTEIQEWKISWKKRKWLDWSIWLLQEFSSNFVDDHYCECADISVMDAWHKNYKDNHWTSLAIVRNQKLLSYIKSNKDLIINKVSTNIILDSQKSGIDSKNKELAIRLKLYKMIYNISIPKRVSPKFWKNPIKIIKTIFHLWIQVIMEKKFIRWKNIDNTIIISSKIYWFLQKIDKICDKIICILNLWK